jgi:hypothetical protein
LMICHVRLWRALASLTPIANFEKGYKLYYVDISSGAIVWHKQKCKNEEKQWTIERIAERVELFRSERLRSNAATKAQ